MARTVKHEGLNVYWGDEDHLEVSQKRSFSQMIFELLSEKTPTESELKLFEMVLNLSIDHGSETPSAVATIQAAKEGKSISEAIAEGLKQINASHGGAIEPCMEMLYRVLSQEDKVRDLVKEYLGQDKRIPGFGHRIYKDKDPRTSLIFRVMSDEAMSDEFVKIAREIEIELESQKGKKLPINIDGAVAVLLCTFDWDPKLSNAVFIIARTPGLCAQYINCSESSNERNAS